MNRLLFLVAAAGLLAACTVAGGRRPGHGGTGDAGGGAGDGGVNGGGDGAPWMCTPSSEEGSPASCADATDNDCDGYFDCSDTDCSGVGSCPVCGEVDGLGDAIALPDGVGSTVCSTDTDCPGAQQCYDLVEDGSECREPYRSNVSFVGFASDATFESASDIVSVCVTMEHSWLRDLEIRLEAPNGQVVRLSAFRGRTGGEIYLGEANDCDDDAAVVPGAGAVYCWSPSATRASMLDYADGGGAMSSVATEDCFGFGPGTADMMPPGDYSADDDWSALVGSPLNGTWSLSIADLWGIDNGYVSDWSITFDAHNVADCSSGLI